MRSIGLDAVARRHVLSDTINDLRSWTLGPFDADTADSFVAELADAYEWVMAPAVRTRILAEIEWLIPHHLQGVMSELMHQPHGGIVDERHVVAAIEALIGRRNYFNSWDERLTPSLGTPHDGHARVILRQCARDPRGAIGASVNAAMADEIADARTRATAIAELRDVLSHDGYLVEDGERLRFRSSILRRFWARHFP